MITSQQEILESSSGVPWPVLVFVVLVFAAIQYVGPKIVERWKTSTEVQESSAHADKAKYEGAAAFIDATGAYGVQILEQLTRVQADLEEERRERYKLERNLARAFGVIGVLEEELDHIREDAGKPPISERIKRMFPELYEMMPDYIGTVETDARAMRHEDEEEERESRHGRSR